MLYKMRPLHRLCFATNNPNKLSEIRQLLADHYDVVSLKEIGCTEELPEPHETLAENSASKARYVFEQYNVSCFADDTGLEIDALGGEPGVHSAHYSGSRDAQANVQLVLQKLNQAGATQAAQRSARFRTIMTLVDPAGEQRQFEGKVEGRIIWQPSGAEGFGYDPIFAPEGYEQTFAEMDAATKNGISHRGRAVAALVAYLKH